MNCNETFSAGIHYVTDAYKRVCVFNEELHADLEKCRAENAKLKQELEAVGTAAYLYGRYDLKSENAALRDRAEGHSKRREAIGGESVLVEVAIPLECIGTVRCDFDGIHHVQVFGEEVVTDEETYRRVAEARDAHLRRMRELGVEV